MNGASFGNILAYASEFTTSFINKLTEIAVRKCSEVLLESDVVWVAKKDEDVTISKALVVC